MMLFERACKMHDDDKTTDVERLLKLSTTSFANVTAVTQGTLDADSKLAASSCGKTNRRSAAPTAATLHRARPRPRRRRPSAGNEDCRRSLRLHRQRQKQGRRRVGCAQIRPLQTPPARFRAALRRRPSRRRRRRNHDCSAPHL